MGSRCTGYSLAMPIARRHTWPSLMTMAQKLSISTSTVQRYLEVLIEMGLSSSNDALASTGDCSSQEYILLTINENPQGGVSPSATPMASSATHMASSATPMASSATPMASSATRVYPQAPHGVAPGATDKNYLTKRILNKNLNPPPLPPTGGSHARRLARSQRQTTPQVSGRVECVPCRAPRGQSGHF